MKYMTTMKLLKNYNPVRYILNAQNTSMPDKLHCPVCILVLLAFLNWGCEEEDQRTPVIRQVSPELLVIGDTMVIEGDNFAPYAYDNLVFLNGKVATTYVAANTRQLKVIVPPGSLSGELVIEVSGMKSSPFVCDVFKRDVQIFSVSPDNTLEAPPGSIVEIKGQNFLENDFVTGKAKCLFSSVNGPPLAATVVYATADLLQVVVPDGIKTGAIYINQEGFDYEGPVFTVSAPQILTVSPRQVHEGDLVSITGKGLSRISELRLNSFIAYPEQYSDTENSFYVPAAGTGTITIEYFFENEWWSSGQTLDIVPRQNIVRTVHWIRNQNSVVKTSVDASGHSYDANVLTGIGIRCMTRKNGIAFFGVYNAIFRADGDGHVSDLYTNDVGIPNDITTDGSMLYWSDYNTGCIKAAPANGSGPVQYLYCGQTNYTAGIEIVGDYLYWSDPANLKLMRAKADGTGSPETVTLSGATIGSLGDVDFAEVNGKLMVYIVDINGSGGFYLYTGELLSNSVALTPFTSLTPDTGAPYFISYVNVDVDRNKVVWGNNYTYGAFQFWESDLDGSNPVLIMTNESNFLDIGWVIE